MWRRSQNFCIFMSNLPALKKSLSSRWNILNSFTNDSLYSPGFFVILVSIASVATKSSGPAFRWSLFCIVCLICNWTINNTDNSWPIINIEKQWDFILYVLWGNTLRSCGMSFRWAISLIRVRGTDAVNSALKDGKHGWIFRMTRTSCMLMKIW